MPPCPARFAPPPLCSAPHRRRLPYDALRPFPIASAPRPAPQTVRRASRRVVVLVLALGLTWWATCATDGVWNTSDPQFATDFENVYTQQSLMVKWYSILGNHDYGFNPDAQIQYQSPNANRWVMDARYYTRRVLISGTQYVTFIFLDTNPCVSAYRADDPSGWDPCGSSYPSPADCQFHKNILAQSCTTQYNWLKETVAAIPKGDWIIAAGHHVANEIDVEDMISVLTGAGMDLYLNGHAHTLTYYTLDGAGSYVTTGAGCMVKIDSDGEEQHNHPALATNTHTVNEVWNQKVAGFTTHQFSEDLQSLTTSFIDYQGNNLYSFTVKKGGGPTPPPSTGSCKDYGCVYSKYNKCQCNYYCEKCTSRRRACCCCACVLCSTPHPLHARLCPRRRRRLLLRLQDRVRLPVSLLSRLSQTLAHRSCAPVATTAWSASSAQRLLGRRRRNHHARPWWERTGVVRPDCTVAHDAARASACSSVDAVFC